ncbi:MAG: putative DNA binding domain-containing protein [Clostridia bacterium]|nr:putative DNA binding domain-containing protein [Clostridia bacterium]
MNSVADIVNKCRSYDNEPEWFEFKQGTAVSKPDDIGVYISALSNAAVLAGQPASYLIWGVQNSTHELTGTKFNYQKDIDNEPFQHYLSRYVSPALYFHFDEDVMDGHRVVVLTIPAARIVPTSYKDERWIRIGSSKERLKKYPDREAALFRVLNSGLPDLLNTESRFAELSFDQLFLYYDMRGIKLNKKTFKQNLELLTPGGKYNMLAQLLSDNSHIPIRFSVFKGKDKTSTMYAVREYGNMCLLMSLDKVLDFGDTLNVPQADERERKVERKEVPLFSKEAFSEAVINAFAHNQWVNENSPMFTAYEDRIEIVSLGT